MNNYTVRYTRRRPEELAPALVNGVTTKVDKVSRCAALQTEGTLAVAKATG